MDAEQLGGIGEVVAGTQRRAVGRHHFPGLPKLLHHPLEQRLQRPVIQPEHHPEREEVLAPRPLATRELRHARGFVVQPRHRHRHNPVTRQRPILERVGRVACFGQVGRIELVLVDDQDAAGLHFGQVHLQRRRVHRHQHVRLIARRRHLLIREMQLISAHPGERTRGRPDLGREIGLGADGVAHQGGKIGELAADQLHAIAGVAGESHRGLVDFLELFAGSGRGGHSDVQGMVWKCRARTKSSS